MPSPNPSAAKMPSHPAQTDRANLQIIISTLESLSRTQGVLRKFLIQACMDVERNGLSSTIRVPHRIVQHFSVTPTEKEHIMSKACFQPLISAISRNIGSPQIGEGPYPLEKEGRNVGESVQRSDVAIRPSAALPISASASASEEASPLNTNVFSETRPPSSCGNTSPGTFTGSHGGGDGSAPSFLDQLSDSVMENALRGDWGVVMQGNGLDWDPAAA